jgi:hypothetical protein
VEAGQYGYAHSCVTSENFPMRSLGAEASREIVLLDFAREITSTEAIAEATRLGLERPRYEDALHFGVEHPGVQLEAPGVFLHDPWLGFFAGGTCSVCGAMPGDGSWASKASTTAGVRAIGSRS